MINYQQVIADMQQATSQFFEQVSFKAIPLADSAWHFQAFVLRCGIDASSAG